MFMLPRLFLLMKNMGNLDACLGVTFVIFMMIEMDNLDAYQGFSLGYYQKTYLCIAMGTLSCSQITHVVLDIYLVITSCVSIHLKSNSILCLDTCYIFTHMCTGGNSQQSCYLFHFILESGYAPCLYVHLTCTDIGKCGGPW